MTREIRAGGDVAAVGLREATTSIEAVHRQIARRTPSPEAHDAVAATVYACVRAGLTLGARGAGLLASATSSAWVTPERERAGKIVRAALNGAFGDALQRSGNALSIPMAVRVNGCDVPPTRGALLDAFPDATSRVVVFLHGLGETDGAWRPDAADGYGSRLRVDLGFTPVYVRYNSGLPIAENGEQLSSLLTTVTAAWPVPLDEVALVGHSLGALVIRAACHSGGPWCEHVRTAVYLGAPHSGAALEKGARLLATTLQRVPETRAIAATINARSAGIHDLGDGVICADEQHVPLRTGIRHHAVVATLGGHALVGHALGDLLVRRGSALGRGSRSRPDLVFDAADVHEVAGATHFALLCHPGVYERLRAWLTPAEPPRPRLLPRRTGAAHRRRFA